MLTLIFYILIGMLAVCTGAFTLFIILEFIAYVILYGKDGYDE